MRKSEVLNLDVMRNSAVWNPTPDGSRRGSRNSPGPSKRNSLTEKVVDFVDEAFSTARAKHDANSELQIRLRHAEQLASIPKLIEEYKAKLRDCEDRLSAAQRTQVDDVSNGLRCIDTSLDLLQFVETNNKSLSASSVDCMKLFGDGWPAMKRAAVAQTNMTVTQKVLSHFREIPKRIEELEEKLDSDDAQIKAVYTEFRGLVQLRDAAASSNYMSDFTDDRRRNDFLEKRADTFRKLQECANFVAERIWENIEDTSMLAAVESIVLLRTLEVIEMEDMAKRKVFSGLEEDSKFVPIKKPKSMREQMFDKLREVISKQFESLMQTEAEATKMDNWWATVETGRQNDIKSFLTTALKNDSSTAQELAGREYALTKDQFLWLKGQILAAHYDRKHGKDHNKSTSYIISVFDELTQLMKDREKLCDLLAPLFPPSHRIAEFYRNEYRAGALGVITMHTDIPRNLNKGEILKIVNFLLWFERDQNKPGFLASTVEQLMEAYVKSTRETITNMINNILRLDEEATEMKGPDGFVITTGPSDLFFTINTQLEICIQAGLRGTAVEYLALMLGDVLTDYTNHQIEFLNQAEQRDGRIFLGERRLEKSPAYLCAIVNNCSWCQDNLEEVRENLENACMAKPTDGLKNDQHHLEDLEQSRNKINDYLEQTAEGFVTVKTQAVDLLANLALEGLEEYMAKLFGPQWIVEKFEESATDAMLLALQDSLEQYKDLLSSDPPFLRIVKFVLKSLVTEYLHKFLEVKPKITDGVLEQIKKDSELLRIFFSNYTDTVILSTKFIDEEIGIMQLVEKVLGADTDFMSVHFAAVTHRFKRKSMMIMRGLLAVREELSKKDREDILKSFQQQLPPEYKEDFKEPEMKHQGSKLKAVGGNSGNEASGRGFWSKLKSKKTATKEKPSEKRKNEQPAPGPVNTTPSAWSAASAANQVRKEEDEAVDLADFLGSGP